MPKLIFLLFFLPFSAFAQEVTFSDDFPIKQDIAYYLIDNMEDSFVLFRDIPRDRKIHVMDDKMMSAGEVPLEFQFKNPRILDVVRARDNQFSVIYTAKKKGTKYLRIENFDKFGILKDTLTIESSSGMIEMPKYEIEKSDDESMVLVYNVKYDKSIRASLVDIKNLKVIWSQHFEDIPIENLFQIKQYVVGNDGSFCLVLLKDNSSLKRDKARFELYTYQIKTKKLVVQLVPLEGKLSAECLFKFDNLNRSILAGGLYAEKNTIKAQGYYYLKVPQNSTANTAEYKLEFTRFEPDFLKEYSSRKNVNENSGIISTQIRDLVLRNDGGMLLVGEKIELKSRNSINGPISRDPLMATKADYYFDQLFMASIHPTGKQHWINVFQKNQYSFDDGGIYSSYFVFVGKQGLHLMFNDEVRNQSTISDFLIQGDGEYKRRAIINTVGLDIRMRIRDALQVGANEIVVPSQYRNKLKMVKFSF